jgi:hypothetical protein
MSRDPADDERIYLRLGVAMSKAQLLELALVKMVEAQRQDLSLPLDERWAEISKWIDMTAGELRRLLAVPEVVATDVRSATGRRNRIAHDVWLTYSVGNDTRASADIWAPWLDREAAMLQHVAHGLMHLRDYIAEVRTGGAEPDEDDLIRVWRQYVPEVIAPREDRTPSP